MPGLSQIPTGRAARRGFSWSAENIIYAMRLWQRRHQLPPRLADWASAGEDHPCGITVVNRFATHADNDRLQLHATGLPPNTGFDVFLVEHSPLDAGPFSDFGVGWYQSDMESNGAGSATITVRGIFDKETFVLEQANPLSLVHTYNVGFWFNSPDESRDQGDLIRLSWLRSSSRWAWLRIGPARRQACGIRRASPLRTAARTARRFRWTS